MRRVAAVVLVVAVLAALFAFGLKPRDDRDVASVRLGKPMPGFEAPVLPRYVEEYGEILRLSDYLNRGRPVVVNVWASWCEACVAEAPRLEAAWERYQGRLMMIGIDFQDRPVNGGAFVERFDHGFPSVSDARGRIGIDWGCSACLRRISFGQTVPCYTSTTGRSAVPCSTRPSASSCGSRNGCDRPSATGTAIP